MVQGSTLIFYEGKLSNLGNIIDLKQQGIFGALHSIRGWARSDRRKGFLTTALVFPKSTSPHSPSGLWQYKAPHHLQEAPWRLNPFQHTGQPLQSADLCMHNAVVLKVNPPHIVWPQQKTTATKPVHCGPSHCPAAVAQDDCAYPPTSALGGHLLWVAEEFHWGILQSSRQWHKKPLAIHWRAL